MTVTLFRRRRAPRWVGLALATVLLAGGVVAAASADDRDDELAQQRSALAGQAGAAQAQVDGRAALLAEAEQRVTAAQASVAQAAVDVTNARAALAAAQEQVAQAKALDDQRARELAQAEDQLAAARQREQQGQHDLADERDQLAQATALSFQQDNPLLSVATIVDAAGGTADLSNRIQWAANSIATTQSGLDRLEQIQRQLMQQRGTTEVAEARADDAKQAAAAQLATTQAVEQAAQVAEAALEQALATQQQALAGQQQAEAAAAGALADAKTQLASVQDQQAAVNAEIAQRAEAARQAAAAAAAEAAAGAAGQAGSGPVTSSSAGLIWPIDPSQAWISSPFGWRVNPIGGYSELHDGTDFAAGCGTPIRAVVAGTVIKSYFGDGYGNRIFVDHGWVGGVYMISASNHMMSPGLPVGTYVNQGDIIGYVGTTGYSTGCHLHFHLYVNGGLVDPTGYL